MSEEKFILAGGIITVSKPLIPMVLNLQNK